MTEPIVVIGSNSFSGSHFVDFALSQGFSVVGVSRSEEPNPVFLPYKTNANVPQFRFHRCDLKAEHEQLFDLLGTYRPAYVVNFAAQGMVAQSWKFPVDWYQTNLVAQVRLHEFLRKNSWLKKYVHVTTPEVYGSTGSWMQESFNFSPSTPYAVSRAACDLHLMSFFKAYGFPVVFTRAANVYGPGQQLYRILPRALLFGRLGHKLELHGGGSSTRSFIHIKDVVKATYQVMLDGRPGETFHISTKKSISIFDLVKMVANRLGIAIDDLVTMSEDRLGKDQAYLLDSTKLRTTLGWRDEIILEDGVEDVVTWIDRNLDILRTLPFDYEHKS
jgi:dTDP-glucose 4,6-dehydratase